ncbi:vacuolar protein sorting-associated protein 16, partial [Phenoliferia sp. Uapishka_3]
MVDDQIKLLVFQESLEKESLGKSFVGLSVNETIRACILGGFSKKVDKIKKDFGVTDKRFWYVKMKALVEMRDWDGLETFSKKKSPIGFEPWVEHLISTGSPRQAVTYVAKCEQKNKVELYVKCGEWVMAGQECVRRSDRGRLQDLRRRSPNGVISAELDQLLDELSHGGM